MSEEKQEKATTTETPLDRYARLRPGMIPKAELAEGAFTNFVSESGSVFRLGYVLLEYPEKSAAMKYTGTLMLEGEGYSLSPGFMVDTVTNLYYPEGGDRLEADLWAHRIVASKFVKDAAGRNRKYNLHLSFGTDGVIVTSDEEELNFGLLRWTGDGFMHLEIPSGTAVKMKAVTDTDELAPPDLETPQPHKKPKE